MVVRSRGHGFSIIVATLALAFSFTGCGDGAREGTQDEPVRSPTSSAEVLRTLQDRLLRAKEVPGFNDTFTWRVTSNSRREGIRPVGTCHRFAMTSIGATQVRVRRYAGARDPGSAAANLVAEFADEKTAKRAYEVLTSWRAGCVEQLKQFDRREIGRLRAVELPGDLPPGSASWYLLVYGPAPGDPDAGYFDAQGLIRVGARISVLGMRLVGQDYNYEPGQEPMVGAVRASAAKLAVRLGG